MIDVEDTTDNLSNHSQVTITSPMMSSTNDIKLPLFNEHASDENLDQELNNIDVDGPLQENRDSSTMFGLTRYHFLVLVSAWLGWSFDIYDGIIFSYAAPLCVPMLLGYKAEEKNNIEVKEAIALWTAILTSILLIGWAVGGILFGIVTDKLGRSRAMMMTILCYSIATGTCAFSFHIAFLAIFRFISALGIGGEWAAGSSLIAEALPQDKRVLGGVIMYTAAPFGSILAYGVTFLLTSSYTSFLPDWISWRIVFATAILPSLLGVVIRHGLKEPDSWHNSQINREKSDVDGGEEVLGENQVKTQGHFLELFGRDLRWKTISSLLVVIFALVAWYCVTSFIPVTALHLATEYAQQHSLSQIDTSKLKDIYTTVGILAYNLGGLIGTLLTYPIAQRFGRVWLFRIYFFFSTIFLILSFAIPMPGIGRLILLFPCGIFMFGVFAAFTFYLPELFPTRIRGTGCGFSYNTGRVVTAFFPFIAGLLLNRGISPIHVILSVAVMPLIGFIFSVIPRSLEETKDVLID